MGTWIRKVDSQITSKHIAEAIKNKCWLMLNNQAIDINSMIISGATIGPIDLTWCL